MYRVVAGYFLLVASVAALLFFPELRRRGIALFATGGAWTASRLSRLSRFVTRYAQRGQHALTSGSAHSLGFAAHHKRALLAAGLVLLIPPVVAFSINPGILFEFGAAPRAHDARIADLLRGERLAPPPPLAPAVFTTREVELFRPDALHASRDWSLLEPAFRQRLLLVIKMMREQHGYQVVLLEGYRSPARQDQLAARGTHVTGAAAYQSYHQYGLAADCAFYRDGKLVITERDPWAMKGYELFGDLAESVGLTWGGRWRMRDFGHVELPRPERLGTTLTVARR